jgi:hypothetical protein
MDWTGGTRRRFAGARNNNAALQKQKAHFAKARAAVQHEPSTGHQTASAVAHNDDTRDMSLKGSTARLSAFCASLTRSGSGRGSASARYHSNTSTNRRQDRTTDSTINAAVHEDEELLLIARRRKLLARNDWLALDPTRPLRIGFPTAGDKHDVGRRKKVKRSSATGPKAAQRRLLTPLFEERVEPAPYLMSGALPPAQEDNIEVKVGTNAFDSQSRPSRRSNTPRHLSVGPQSTILRHLSEESMLLGADGDTFDADQVDVSAHVQDGRDSREGTVRVLSMGSEERYNEEDAHRRGREYSPTRSDSSGPQQLEAWNHGEGIDSTANHRHRPGHINNVPLISYPSIPEPSIWDAEETQAINDPEYTARNRAADSYAMLNPAGHDASEIDAEKAWRWLMGIATQSESFTSNKALDSSSDHITTSDTVQRAFPGFVQREANLDGAIAISPEAANYPLDRIELGPDSSNLNHSRLTRAQDPPATSVQSPKGLPGTTGDHTDNEALWREFIIGSQDSESGDDLHSAWQRNREKTQESSELPRPLQLSGFGTSDHATRGEAVVASPTLFAVTDAGFDDEPDSREASVEDNQLDLMATPSSPRNIHATSTKKLSSQRSKRSREQKVDVTRKEGHARTRTLRRGTQSHGRV